MLYPIIIENPLIFDYGSKKTFKIPSNFTFIKSITVNIEDIGEVIKHVPVVPGSNDFDLFKMSILLNNGKDYILTDIPFRIALLQESPRWSAISSWNFLHNNLQKILINKKVIQNAQHFAVFKITDEFLTWININADAQTFGTYIRENLKIIIYIDAD